MELYKLAQSCEYGELTTEMIRDRLVVGISDRALSERLQLTSPWKKPKRWYANERLCMSKSLS